MTSDRGVAVVARLRRVLIVAGPDLKGGDGDVAHHKLVEIDGRDLEPGKRIAVSRKLSSGESGVDSSGKQGDGRFFSRTTLRLGDRTVGHGGSRR